MREFIFYALISETKDKAKELYMKGPFMHIKPPEVAGNEANRHMFSDKDEVKKEKKYLTKKFHNEVIIFIPVSVTKAGELSEYDFLMEKNAATLKADGLFKKQLELMKENYQICTKY